MQYKNYISTKFYTKILSQILKKFLYGFVIQSYKLYCFTMIWNLIEVFTFLKNFTLIQAASLVDIVVIDNIKNKNGRFCITYCFWSYTFGIRIFVRSFVNLLVPVISASNLYNSADWLEREVWDMFGIKFLFHKDLRRILTDYGFQGHPLRKDFPLIGFTEIRYNDSVRSITVEPVELSQDFRYFKYDLPWIK